MQVSFTWRCATCGHEADANLGFCPKCGAPAGPPTVAERWNRDHPGDPMLTAGRGRREPQAIPTRPRSRRGRVRALERAWSPLVIVSSFAGTLLAVTLWATGAFDSGSSTSSRRSATPADSRPVSPPPPTASATGPQPKRPVATARLGAHRVFAGRAFSVAYPRGWTITAAEAR